MKKPIIYKNNPICPLCKNNLVTYSHQHPQKGKTFWCPTHSKIIIGYDERLIILNKINSINL